MSFDKKRSGAVLGDGGAFLILETLESALKRGAKIYCEILSYNANCTGNGDSLTNPDEEGCDTYQTLRDCMVDANISPSELDAVNC
jgi:3-oxoacyl-[acyl-carrier-protein] synthase II